MPAKRKSPPALKPEARLAFASKLAALRGMMPGAPNQEQFAKFLGLKVAETYRRWERAETEPDITMLRRIVDRTAVSLDWLLDVEHLVHSHPGLTRLTVVSRK